MTSVMFTGKNSQIGKYFTHDYAYCSYNLEDSSTWDSLLDSEYVFLLLPKTPQLLELSKDFILAAEQSRIRQIIKIGSLGPYRAIHQQLECFMRLCRVPYTSFDIAPLMNNIFTEQYDYDTATLENYRGQATAPYLDPRCLANAIESVVGNSQHYNRNYAMTGPHQLTIHQVVESLRTGGWPVDRIHNVGYETTHTSLRSLDADHRLMKKLGSRYYTELWAPAVSKDWKLFNGDHRTLDQFIAQDVAIYTKLMELDKDL